MNEEMVRMVDEICLLHHKELCDEDKAFMAKLYRQNDINLTENQAVRVFSLHRHYVKGVDRVKLPGHRGGQV